MSWIISSALAVLTPFLMLKLLNTILWRIMRFRDTRLDINQILVLQYYHLIKTVFNLLKREEGHFSIEIDLLGIGTTLNPYIEKKESYFSVKMIKSTKLPKKIIEGSMQITFFSFTLPMEINFYHEIDTAYKKGAKLHPPQPLLFTLNLAEKRNCIKK